MTSAPAFVERIVLASIDGTATVGEIAALHVLDLEAAATAVRRLAALGAVDL